MDSASLLTSCLIHSILPGQLELGLFWGLGVGNRQALRREASGTKKGPRFSKQGSKSKLEVMRLQGSDGEGYPQLR